MDRSYAILGLRDDATKQQVKDAYERRLRKYKTADYADDPEYAARKVAELKAAYGRAYQMAGGADPDDSTMSSRPKPTSSHRNAHKEHGAAHTLFDRELHPERKYNKPCGLAEKVKDGAGLDDVKSGLKRFAGNLRDAADNFGDMASGNSEKRLGASGEVENIFVRKPKQKKTKVYKDNAATGKKIASVLIAVITIGSALIPMIFDSFNDVDLDFGTPDSYSRVYLTDEDTNLYETAQKANTYMYENFTVGDEFTGVIAGDPSRQVDGEADEFVKNYGGWETMGEASDYLYGTYGDYWVDSNSNVATQIKEYLEFYGFESFDYAVGFVNPYNDTKIQSMAEYLDFLNEYYEREVAE